MKAKKCCGVAAAATPAPSVADATAALLSAALADIRSRAAGAPAGEQVVIDRYTFVQTCWSLLDDRVPAWRVLNYFSGDEDLGPDSVEWLLLADEVMLALAERGLLSYVDEDPDCYAVMLLAEPAEHDVAC